MKTALKISQEEKNRKKRHNNNTYANKKHKQNQHSQNKKQAKETNKGKKGNKKIKTKIIQLLTVVPEIVTLDCSLTYLLQVPNTQPYHS